MTRRWDLLVVGGGTAGIVAAKTATRLGASVLLVERERTGGDCLWTGCVPSKALLAAASGAASARAAYRLGVHVGDVTVDFEAVMAHVHGAMATIAPVDSPETLEREGVAVRSGDFTFTGPTGGTVSGDPVAFAQAVVCTGSSPVVPGIPGLEAADPLTSDTVWDLEELPERLAVLGGGTIGCELGQAFARLGSRVTLVEGLDRVLGNEDRDASALLDAALRRDGVDLRTGSPVVEVVPGENGNGALRLEDGSSVDYDRVLVAVGRRPGTADLGLETAGVRTDERGHVAVDDHLRTDASTIWAAGDVTGHPQFTHTAGVHGSLAASNAVLGVRRTVDLSANPRVTFTDPEVAAVGVGADRAAGDRGLDVVTVQHDEVDRGVAEDRTDGYSSLVIDRRGRLVGATVVGPRAGETIGELTLAVRQGLRTRDLAGVTHAYPTYNDGAWNAAVADLRRRLEKPTAEKVLRSLAAVRRTWLDRRQRSDR